ncbi:MAG: hypothetical protein BRD41_06570 [Bacteroidetes bacterium QS_1_63_11]|nr:MAG: hypothetical protein BRD41_06570 [Bacteroidetes bacterium QS_1_63_11]
MPQKTTKIELTPDELREEREAAATGAAREVFDELKEGVEALCADLKQAAVARDIMLEHVLLDWPDVSRRILKRWDVPVNSEQGQTRFYMPTAIDYLAQKTEDEKLELKLVDE